MKKLSFEWVLREDVNSMEEITTERVEMQINKLNVMLNNLKEKLSSLNGVIIDNNYLIDCNGKYGSKDSGIVEYSINNRMNIIISKQGRKSTWNDVYKVVNTVQSAKYNFIQY